MCLKKIFFKLSMIKLLGRNVVRLLLKKFYHWTRTWSMCQVDKKSQTLSHLFMLDILHSINKIFLPAELRSQLTRLEKCVAHIPDLVVCDLLKDHIARSQTTRKQHEQTFTQQLQALREKQVSYMSCCIW